MRKALMLAAALTVCAGPAIAKTVYFLADEPGWACRERTHLPLVIALHQKALRGGSDQRSIDEFLRAAPKDCLPTLPGREVEPVETLGDASNVRFCMSDGCSQAWVPASLLKAR